MPHQLLFVGANQKSGPSAAPTYDDLQSVTTSATFQSGGAYMNNLTPRAGGDMIVVAIGGYSSGGLAAASPVFDENFTQLLYERDNASGDARWLWVGYRLLDNVNDAKGFSIHWETATTFVAQAYIFSGVDQTTPITAGTATVTGGKTSEVVSGITMDDFSTYYGVALLAESSGVGSTFAVNNGATIISEDISTTSGVNRAGMLSFYKSYEEGASGASGDFTVSGAATGTDWITCGFKLSGGLLVDYVGQTHTDANFSNVKALYTFDPGDTLTDHSGNADLEQESTGPTFNINSASGGYGLRGGAGFYIRRNTADAAVVPQASEEFTIEYWLRMIAANQSGWMVHNWNSGLNERCWLFRLNLGALEFWFCNDGTNAVSGFPLTSLSDPATNVWHHIAVDRDSSNVFRLYLNGVVQDTATSSLAGFATTQKLMFLEDASGTNTCGSNFFVDNFRYTKGVARYGGAFTKPNPFWPRG